MNAHCIRGESVLTYSPLALEKLSVCVCVYVRYRWERQGFKLCRVPPLCRFCFAVRLMEIIELAFFFLPNTFRSDSINLREFQALEKITVNLTLRETILLEPLDVTRFTTALDVSLSRINLTELIREGSSFLS